MTKENTSYQLPSLEELLEAGVHFGHQSRRWNPKIAPYLYKEQNKIHIFDLIKTHQKLSQACEFLYNLASEGKSVIFVGTKKQASQIVKVEAQKSGAFYLTERWIGGFLTNFDHVRNKMTRLKKIEQGLAPGGQFESYTKKERLELERESQKLEREVGGVFAMEKVPDCLFVVDIKRESTAISEARKVGMIIVGMVDSNCDPNLVDYPIPANDDASGSVEIITKAVGSAVEAGYKKNGETRELEKGDLKIKEDSPKSGGLELKKPAPKKDVVKSSKEKTKETGDSKTKKRGRVK